MSEKYVFPISEKILQFLLETNYSKSSHIWPFQNYKFPIFRTDNFFLCRVMCILVTLHIVVKAYYSTFIK